MAERERAILSLQEKIATMNRQSAEQKDLAEIQIETRLRQEYDKSQALREKNLLGQVSEMHQTRVTIQFGSKSKTYTPFSTNSR